MTYAEKALARLDTLPANEPEWWSFAVAGEGYDPEATAAADPRGNNEVAVYADGSRLEYLEAEHRWVAVQEE